MPSPAFTAALDIGTNSVVLLLLRRDADGVLRRVLEPARITRLGEDTARTGVLKPQAMERTLAAVAELMRGLREVAPHCTGAAAATSAVRDAANGAEFLGRCAEIIGGQPALFSGREEADTMFRGATDGLPPGTRCLCADIGGGSTELAAGEPGRCTARTSLNLGCVRLGETHSLLSRATPADIAAARQAAAELLRGACQGMASSHPLTPLEGAGGTDLFSTAGVAECAGGSGDGVPATRGTPADSATPGLKENRGGATLQRGSGGGENGIPPTVLACGGTATTFAAMAAGVAPFDPERIQGMRFSRACVEEWAARLLPLTPEERARKNPGLSPDRAPVLPAGLLILAEILRASGAPEATVTSRGLRHGICLRLLAGELRPTWTT